MSGSKLSGAVLLSGGALSLICAVTSAGSSFGHTVSEAMTHMLVVIGLSLAGAILLSVGALFLMFNGRDHEREDSAEAD